jgi:hypothetical protein
MVFSMETGKVFEVEGEEVVSLEVRVLRQKMRWKTERQGWRKVVHWCLKQVQVVEECQGPRLGVEG